MSGGHSARFGFLFSDLLVIQRVVEHLLHARIAHIEGRVPPSLLFFMLSPLLGQKAALIGTFKRSMQDSRLS